MSQLQFVKEQLYEEYTPIHLFCQMFETPCFYVFFHSLFKCTMVTFVAHR